VEKLPRRVSQPKEGFPIRGFEKAFILRHAQLRRSGVSDEKKEYQ
jgi:hypothetical protein